MCRRARSPAAARALAFAVVLCGRVADGKAAMRSLRFPLLRSAPVSSLPLAGDVPGAEPWRWSLRTDDGLELNESDLRDKRSNWLRDLLSIGKSRVLLRVADRLFGTTVWAAFVAGIYEAKSLMGMPEDGVVARAMETLLVPTWPHEAVGGFLAILLVFRTDQAYERFWEGRELWATVHSSTRCLSMLALSHYGPGATRDTILGYATIFPIALRQHLRGRRDIAEIERTLSAYVGPHTPSPRALALIARADNVPATVLASLSIELGVLLRAMQNEGATSDPSGQRQAAIWAQMQTHVERLADVIGSCERLKLTPIPLSYSRHTSRFFTLYLLTLPFTLINECNILTVPAICIGIGYVLYAMEEIGHVIEEPFSLAFDEGGSSLPEQGGASPQQRIARAGTDSLVTFVTTFYMTLSMVLGFDGAVDDPEIGRGSAPLEVLPLRKYCAIIELEVATLAAAVAEGDVLSRQGALAPQRGLRGAVHGVWTRARATPLRPAAAERKWRGAEFDAERYHAIATSAVERLRELSKGPRASASSGGTGGGDVS